MSFTDPLSVTISGVASPLPRISVGDDTSEYGSGDGLILCTASSEYKKRIRRMLKIEVSKMTADPFRPAENVKVSMNHYLVFDLPPSGFTPVEALAVYAGFKATYSATSDLLITKLLGGES